MVEYTLTRSNRKTLAIHVSHGYVEVRAPLKTPKQNIDKFVFSKEKWIGDKLSALNERMAQRNDFRLIYGDYVTYRGKQYPIVGKPGDRIGYDGLCFYMPPDLSPEQIKYACIDIYRNLAKRHLTEKAYALAKEMSVTPSAVKINSAKSRWGSCSSKKSVNFSWMLMMADDDVIDYIVVHELAHIIELNHSPRFWRCVENVMPDYKKRMAKLKELQRRLVSEDWS